MAKKANDDVLEKMRSRFAASSEHEAPNRDLWVKNVDMSSSTDQWPTDVINFRGSARPRLTINRLNGTCKQIEGDYRQNELAINVMPASYEAEDDTADILAGIIRHIEQVSNAKTVYLHGIRYASRGGWGWVRVIPEESIEGSFEQELRIRAIYNTLTVYCDPKAVAPTREDARYMFVSEMVDIEEHKAEYPDTDLRFTEALEDFDDAFEDWVDSEGERIRRVEYWTKEKVATRFAQFSNGATLEIHDDKEIALLEQIGWKLVKEKKGTRTQVRLRKCIANQILEERIYDMPYIPLVPFLGEEINIKGKVTLHSAIAYGIDPQHMLNYWVSTATESTALMPKAPYLLTPTQIQNHELQWKNVNVNSQPYVLYNPDSTATPPQRIPMPEQPIGEMAMAGGAEKHIAYTTNTFDAQLGAPGQEVSGVALGERQQQGTTGNYLFIDNGKIAIEHIGRILLHFIPLIYDTERVVRILSLEGKSDTVTINKEIHNPILGTIEVLNDITVGDYQVVVEAGKAFATRRKESVDGMIKWSQAFPQQAPMVADLVIENMDVPGGTQIAERIRRSLPPNIINDPDSPEGQQAMQEAQQKQQQQEALQQQLLQSKIQSEQGKNQAAMAKANAEVVRAQAEVVKAQSDVQIAAIDTHSAKLEHVGKVLDAQRGIEQNVQPSIQTNPQPNPQVNPQPAQPDHNQESNELLKLGIAALAGHAAKAHEMHQQQTANTHQILQHVAHNNELLNNHLEKANQIATAPVEALRDKMGKITGKKIVLPQQQA